MTIVMYVTGVLGLASFISIFTDCWKNTRDDKPWVLVTISLTMLLAG